MKPVRVISAGMREGEGKGRSRLSLQIFFVRVDKEKERKEAGREGKRLF